MHHPARSRYQKSNPDRRKNLNIIDQIVIILHIIYFIIRICSLAVWLLHKLTLLPFLKHNIVEVLSSANSCIIILEEHPSYVLNYALSAIFQIRTESVLFLAMQHFHFHKYLSEAMRKCVLCYMRTTKVQISLRIRAVWSAPLLFAAKTEWYL